MYIKTAKDCTEKKEIIHSQKYETLLKEKSTLVWRRTPFSVEIEKVD